MYLQFQHSFAYTFPKAINKPININYPGPGTYNPGEDNEMINPPKWKFNTASRDNKIKELSPGPAKYDYGLEYRKLSNVPTAPKYTFYKTSGVIPRKRKKKNIKNNNYNNNINNFKLDNNFKEGDNTINLQNINNQRPKTTEIKKKKKKYKLNNNYDDDSNPGVGTYDIRSSLIVPVVKFGTERKDIAYKDTPSRGPASYDIRGNLGNYGPKINFGKEKRGIDFFSFTPGPGNYNLRKDDNGNDAPKYSFNHEVRMKDESFNRKKIVLERNFLKRENYKKIYVFKEDNNVNVDQRNNFVYYVSDYNLSHTGFHIGDRNNFRKSKNGKFDSSYNTFSDFDKIEERKNYDYNNFRKPLWVSKKFYKQYLNEYLSKSKDEKKVEEDEIKVEEDEKKVEEDEIKVEEDEKKIEEDEKKVEEEKTKVEEDERKKDEEKKIDEDEKNIEEDKIKVEEDERKKDEEKIVEEFDKKEEEDEKKVDEEEKNIEEFDKKEEEDDKKEEEDEKIIEESNKKEEVDEKIVEESDKKEEEDKKIVEESDKKEEGKTISKESEIILNEESKLKEEIEIPLN